MPVRKPLRGPPPSCLPVLEALRSGLCGDVARRVTFCDIVKGVQDHLAARSAADSSLPTVASFDNPIAPPADALAEFARWRSVYRYDDNAYQESVEGKERKQRLSNDAANKKVADEQMALAKAALTAELTSSRSATAAARSPVETARRLQECQALLAPEKLQSLTVIQLDQLLGDSFGLYGKGKHAPWTTNKAARVEKARELLEHEACLLRGETEATAAPAAATPVSLSPQRQAELDAALASLGLAPAPAP
eukprot:6232870-Prymnesium_polylepis.1